MGLWFIGAVFWHIRVFQKLQWNVQISGSTHFLTFSEEMHALLQSLVFQKISENFKTTVPNQTQIEMKIKNYHHLIPIPVTYLHFYNNSTNLSSWKLVQSKTTTFFTNSTPVPNITFSSTAAKLDILSSFLNHLFLTVDTGIYFMIPISWTKTISDICSVVVVVTFNGNYAIQLFCRYIKIPVVFYFLHLHDDANRPEILCFYFFAPFFDPAYS